MKYECRQRIANALPQQQRAVRPWLVLFVAVATLLRAMELGAASPPTLRLVSDLFVLDTRFQPMGLQIQGPAELLSGSSATYRAILQYSDGTAKDVTAVAAWQIVSGGAFATSLRGGVLEAGLTPSTAQVQITASYSEAGTTVVVIPYFVVTIQPRLAVSFAYRTEQLNGGVQRYVFSAAATGRRQEPVTYAWDVNSDNQFIDGYGQEWTVDFPQPGSYRIGVRATDKTGASATAYQTVSVERRTVGEPESASAVDIEEGALVGPTGAAFQPLDSRRAAGLLVLVHGMCNSAAEPWLKDMAQAVEQQLASGSVPNICFYDWHKTANPAKYVLTQGASDSTGCSTGELFVNVVSKAIREAGRSQGQELAGKIHGQIKAGKVSKDAKIHLIGHSAGGFVVGECALQLRQAGINASQVTMLDTPHPFRKHVEDCQAGSGRIDRYITSLYGEFAPEVDGTSCELQWWARYAALVVGCGALGPAAGLPAMGLPAQLACLSAVLGSDVRRCRPAVAEAADYHRLYVASVPYQRLDVAAHQYACTWYTATITSGTAEGFWYSPWRGNSFPGRLMRQGVQPQLPSASVSIPLTNFAFFGTASAQGGAYVLQESGNAGILQSVTLPMGTESLRFRYRFTSPGDGDYLTVHWGTNSPVYLGLDTSISRETVVSGEASLAEYAGQSDTLVLKLVSRGQTNAVLTLDSIELTLNDDPDGDGLTSAQEAIVGSDPLFYDTDDDGLSDGQEVNTFRTNPVLADTDGDGAADGQEISAGTDPLVADGALRIESIQANNDETVTLEWRGAANRFYRVNQADALPVTRFSTLTNRLPAQLPLTRYTTPPATSTTQFYWIEVE
jgi:pimeloyl-ACP methyl ester carboxylesterase